MATGSQQTVEQVKSICKSLEASPSCGTASSPIYHGGSKAQGKGAKATKQRLSSAHSKRGH